MRIAVVDVPASEAGALSILKEFHLFVCRNPGVHEWTFIVSTQALDAVSPHVRVLRHHFPKMNWLFRVYWEVVCAPRLIRRLAPDVVFSMQNTALFRTRIPQVVYVHQSLPFGNVKASYFSSQTRLLALYRDLFGVLISRACRQAARVVVQTQWLKAAMVERGMDRGQGITVVPPSVDCAIGDSAAAEAKPAFFYPAGPFEYKRIHVLVNAFHSLAAGGCDATLLLTVTGDENQYSRNVRSLCGQQRQRIHLHGKMSREEVLRAYHESALVFPSVLESFGLPLVEARAAGSYIIASDTPFCREILEGYPRAAFFTPDSVIELAAEMKRYLRLERLPEIDAGQEARRLDRYSPWNTWGGIIRIIEGVGAARTGDDGATRA